MANATLDEQKQNKLKKTKVRYELYGKKLLTGAETPVVCVTDDNG